MNVTAMVVAFCLPTEMRSSSACAPSRSAEQRAQQGLLSQGTLQRWSFEQFGVLEEFLARSRRKDVTWSGGDTVPWLVCVFFMKCERCVGTCCVFQLSSSRVFGVVMLRSVSSVLDTLTLVFELYVWLRERRQRAVTCVLLVGLHCSLACTCGAAVGPFIRDYENERHICAEALWWYLMVVGICTLRGYLFLVVRYVPALSGVVVERCSVKVVWELRPESLKVLGMGLQLCGLQVWCWLVSTILWLVLVERLLDLSSVTARLTGTYTLRGFLVVCYVPALSGVVVERCSMKVV
ncbi:hypothetical protein Taro_012989, partial [Colocasia esculenta]|nr:hypothetical protein [Colocasia esculenta]